MNRSDAQTLAHSGQNASGGFPHMGPGSIPSPIPSERAGSSGRARTRSDNGLCRFRATVERCVPVRTVADSYVLNTLLHELAGAAGVCIGRLNA